MTLICPRRHRVGQVSVDIGNLKEELDDTAKALKADRQSLNTERFGQVSVDIVNLEKELDNIAKAPKAARHLEAAAGGAVR